MESNNIYSIWTRLEPCEYMHSSNREFFNFTSSAEGAVHIIGCADCTNRYLVTNKLLIQTHLKR